MSSSSFPLIRPKFLVILLIAAIAEAAASLDVSAEPSKSQVIQLWEGQNKKGNVLDVVPRGGNRPTSELDGKQYLSPVGSCWDYDVTEIQKCGCRLFEKASVCCRDGSSSGCEIRIGKSGMVDCGRFGKPKFGLSGNTEPAECKQQKNKADCFKKTGNMAFGPGGRVGPCIGVPYFTCPNGPATAQDFWSGKCGPTPEDCGCTMVEECSKPAHVQCYRDWSADKDAVDCYTNRMYKNDYEKSKCYEKLKKSRSGGK